MVQLLMVCPSPIEPDRLAAYLGLRRSALLDHYNYSLHDFMPPVKVFRETLRFPRKLGKGVWSRQGAVPSGWLSPGSHRSKPVLSAKFSGSHMNIGVGSF